MGSEQITTNEKQGDMHKVEILNYQGRQIKIVHMEHEEVTRESRSREYGQMLENSVRVRPLAWREIIDKETERASVVFVEYLPYELETTVYNEDGLNPVDTLIKKKVVTKAREVSKFEQIADFFGYVARSVGKNGIDLAVADVANRADWYLYDQLTVNKWLYYQRLGIIPKELDYRGGYDKNTDPKILKIATATDARRLMTAHGMMMDARARKEGSELVYVGPPAHAQYVSEYIKRQMEAEVQGLKGNPDDLRKMQIYKRTFGLDTHVRYYSPARSADEYRLDQFIEDTDTEEGLNGYIGEQIFVEILDLVNKLINKRKLLDEKGINANYDERNSHPITLHQDSLAEVLEILQKTLKNHGEEKKYFEMSDSYDVRLDVVDMKRIKELVTTKYGWTRYANIKQ